MVGIVKRLLRSLVALPFLAMAGHSQVTEDPNVFILKDMAGGLNTWQSPLLIDPNQSPRLKNIVLDKRGSPERREGYIRLNPTAIGGGSDDVNAVYKLEHSNGTKYCVAFSSTNGTYSTDGCQTFTVFVTTLTRNNDVNCDAFQDRLYCASNGYNFYFTGTTHIPYDAVSGLKYLRVHRNRCFAAGASANLSRLYFSALGNCSSWNTTGDFIDINPNDGDVITGIGPPIFDMLPIYKGFSAHALKGVDFNSFTLVPISKETGSKNHRTIQNLFNLQLFDSLGPNGGQPGIYAFNGIVITEASKNLRNDIDLIDSFRAAVARRTIDEYSDWTAGTYAKMALSADRTPGLMQSSYTSLGDAAGADYALFSSSVNISTVSANPGYVSLQISTFGFANSGFENASLNNWSDFTGKWDVTTAGVYFGTETAKSNCSSRKLSMQIQNEAGTTLRSYRLIQATHTVGYEAVQNFDTSDLINQKIRLKFSIGDTEEINGLISSTTWAGQVVRVYRSFTNAGCDGTDGVELIMDMQNTVIYSTSGIFTSRTFDTVISTPIWGSFNVPISSQTSGAVVFKVQSSTDGSTWDALVAVNNNSRPDIAAKRYFRYQLEFTSTASTMTAVVDTVSIAAASTGTWQSAELFLSNNITDWGLFNTNQTAGAGTTLTYSIRSSTYSGATSLESWTTIASGDDITISTFGPYFQVGSTFTITSATSTLSIDNITINWVEGTQAKSASAAVFQNRYHYGAQSLGGRINDVMYVLDSNGAWTKWDNVFPRMLNVVNQNLIMAGSSTTSGGFMYQMYNGDSDAGSPITAIYETKDFDFGSAVKFKSIDKIFTVNSANNTTLDLTLLPDTGIDSATYSLNLATGAAFSIQQFSVEPPKNGRTFRLRFSNNAASAPWDVLGVGFYVRDLGLIQP